MNDRKVIGKIEEEKFQDYRKKPVVIQAYPTDVELDIETLEGTHHASVGDYIIRGVQGELYPCKPDIFKETYEDVTDEELDLYNDFTEYEELIDNINQTARELVQKETEYAEKGDAILKLAAYIKKENGDDIIKQKYGGNNDKTRKKYVEDELKAFADDIQELKFKKEEYNRRLGFIKRLIDMKTAMIKYGGA